MADSTNGKNKKSLDAFADDLDAMLNISDASSQQVGMIEDDDAIDRLLMGNTFQADEQEKEPDEFADIDALLSSELDDKSKNAGEIDEFGDDIDDVIASLAINPKQQAEMVVEEVDEFADFADETELVQDIDDVTTPELTALESVADLDEFAEPVKEVTPSSTSSAKSSDEIEGMAEIDEFSDASPAVDHSADFLMADFDISSDDDIVEPPVNAASAIDEFADDAVAVPAGFSENQAVEEVGGIEEPEAPAQQPLVDEFEETLPVTPAPVAPILEKPVPAIDHSSELAALTSQITVLKKQNQVFKQEMTEKAGKEELVKCLNEIDSLQTEQKKTKRAVDAVGNQKPVAAYVANGVAVAALLIGSGLGFQGFIAKSQVGELVQIIGKLQEQINNAPAKEAADQEMLRKQLDELTVANSVTANQVAEISKALKGDGGSAPASSSVKAGGDVGKQLADLSNQDMQMGAAIEALQGKVSALEKGRLVVAAPKVEKKKPEVVEENWAVNLIAFKQDWYAKRKAEEFAGKGVPAKVSRTESKGETWYRLSVDGFKSQYEAAGYAAKVKKTLNLDSVWVTRNKE